MKVAPPLHLAVPDSAPLAPPPPRGRLLTAEQIAADVFGDSVSPSWVRRNMPHRIVLGHSTVRWYESDVLVWVETRRAP